MPQFNRYIDIDYSGAETADSSCKGLRVYAAEGSGTPVQVPPHPSPRRRLNQPTTPIDRPSLLVCLQAVRTPRRTYQIFLSQRFHFNPPEPYLREFDLDGDLAAC